MKQIEMYTDGACKCNPGAGGYGTILVYQGRERELSGGESNTTNNRMELFAVITGLEELKEPCLVTIYSDSKYIIDAITQKWVYGWQKKNWIKSDGKPALNVDLWQRLLQAMKPHEITWMWVKGHNGHTYNERCDVLATTAATAQKSHS